jgi:hypothetical protein
MQPSHGSSFALAQYWTFANRAAVAVGVAVAVAVGVSGVRVDVGVAHVVAGVATFVDVDVAVAIGVCVGSNSASGGENTPQNDRKTHKMIKITLDINLTQ